MRVMILIKASQDTEAGMMPSEDLLAAMGRYNEELVNAGVMLGGEGLHPTSRAVRVRMTESDRTVVTGPFPDTKHLICGFWLWKVASMEEAIDWVKKCPMPYDGEAEIEIRRIFEAEDFGDSFTPELREQEEKLRVRLEGKG